MLYTELKSYDSPKHRINEVGPGSLNTAELLAVALRINNVETAEALADLYRKAGSLGRIQRSDILKIKGLGDGYADAVTAIVEIAKREIKNEVEIKSGLESPSAVFDLVGYEMSNLTQEELWVLLLDNRNKLIKIHKLYRGTLNSSNVRVAEVFREAAVANAANIIVVHNHPSGDPSPSPEDIHLTRALVQAGKLMDIEVLDHIVVGNKRYASLKEKGLGF